MNRGIICKNKWLEIIWPVNAGCKSFNILIIVRLILSTSPLDWGMYGVMKLWLNLKIVSRSLKIFEINCLPLSLTTVRGVPYLVKTQSTKVLITVKLFWSGIGAKIINFVKATIHAKMYL